MENKKKKLLELMPLVALLALVVLIVILLILNKDDGSEPKNRVFYGMTTDGKLEPYFDTPCVVYDYSGMSEDEFDGICLGIEKRLEKYHKLFNIYNEYDGVVNLAYLNSRAGEGEIEISDELFEFLEYCVSVCELSGGEVNIAMGSVLSIWHDYREAAFDDPDSAAIPTTDELLAAARHIDLSDIVLREDGRTVELLDPEMRLDVGALGKGYAAEMIAQWLISEGVSGFVLDFGGNIRAVGEKPSGEGWRTGIIDPDGSGYVRYFDIKNTSVVTSGDYERYYTVADKRYHHIIDKDTLMPAEHFASVSIVTESSALADGLSTALFCMTHEEGLALIESLREQGITVRVVWVGFDGGVLEA